MRLPSLNRLIYPATESTPEVTKLQVVEYYLSVGDGVIRARCATRPATLERSTSGDHEGITLATVRSDESDALALRRMLRRRGVNGRRR